MNPKSRQPIPTVHTSRLDRVSERCRRCAEVSDTLNAAVRAVDPISPAAAGELNAIAGKVLTLLFAGLGGDE